MSVKDDFKDVTLRDFDFYRSQLFQASPLAYFFALAVFASGTVIPLLGGLINQTPDKLDRFHYYYFNTLNIVAVISFISLWVFTISQTRGLGSLKYLRDDFSSTIYHLRLDEIKRFSIASGTNLPQAATDLIEEIIYTQAQQIVIRRIELIKSELNRRSWLQVFSAISLLIFLANFVLYSYTLTIYIIILKPNH